MKNIKVDFSSDRLLQTAEKLMGDHNYIGALKILNKNTQLNGESDYAHMLYAEAYDDMELYERSINEWFKFLATCPDADDDDLYDAYEGLAVDYMNIGAKKTAAFYYAKLFEYGMPVDEEVKYDIMESFLADDNNPLKFVYPPEIADCSEILRQGLKYLKTGNFKRAIEKFDMVDSKNKSYLTARNYVATSHLIADQPKKAEEECLKILAVNPKDVAALTTLAAAKTSLKEEEESKKIAYKLIDLNITAPDDLFKAMTVCCENKMHKEALEILQKLEISMPYDLAVLYFKAVASFNCEEYDKCFAAFDKLLTINPQAVTAKYFCEQARISMKKKKKEPMSYFYRLPPKEREQSIRILTAVSMLPPKDVKSMFSQVDISDCIRWCLDECEGTSNSETMLVAALSAVRGENFELVEEILLNAFVDNDIKIKMLIELGELNIDREYNFVICDILKKVSFYSLKLGAARKKHFIRAYATLTAQYAMLDETFSKKFAFNTEKLYYCLQHVGRLKEINGDNMVAALVIILSNVKLPTLTKRDKICKSFGVEEDKLTDILRSIDETL